MYTIDRAPFTGAPLHVTKQHGVKQLAGEMVRASIIPALELDGFNSGVAGFIYNSEINDIYAKHQNAVNLLVDAYADETGEHPYTLIANVGSELNMSSAEYIDQVKTVLAVDWLCVLMSEYATIDIHLTSGSTTGFEVENLQWDTYKKSINDRDFDDIAEKIARENGADFVWDKTDNARFNELDENGAVLHTYNAELHVYLNGQFVAII
jgi:hypothetical protein